jgi:5-hydroxyisourate hydrolase-like protein (transthyretin family)
VSGVLHVDGSPAAEVEVAFHPQDANAKIKYQITTTTDKDGKFSATTYESGDGLPPGDYKITFAWLEGLTTQKDRLKGKFKNAKKSTHSVTVKGTEDEKVDLGTIELQTK